MIVVDHVSGRAVGGATVTVLEPGSTFITDGSGRVTISGLAAGAYRLRTELAGYATRTDSVLLGEHGSVDVRIILAADPVTLAAIEVTVRRPVLEASGFYERRDFGPRGRFFTAEDVERLRPSQMTDLFQRVQRTRVVDQGVGRKVVRFLIPSAGSLGCAPALFLDGMLIRRIEDFNLVSVSEIDGLEVYVGALAPLQYRLGPCGTVLVWTKRG